MSQIKGKNTKPEILVRKFLFSNGYRYKLNDKNLPGKPDIVLPRFRTAVFINGCFWHGHKDCKYFKIPESRSEWWKKKINDTKVRDKIKYKKIEELHWKVITIWECELIKDLRNQTLNKLTLILQKNQGNENC